MMKNSHETLVIHNAIAVLKDRLLPDAFITQLSQFYAAALTKNLSICGSFIRLDFRS